jgi:hypothetical protein
MNKISNSDVLCDRFGGPTTPAIFVQPLGNVAGARTYDFAACADIQLWRVDAQVPQQQVQRQPVHLQQQQPQSKKEPEDGTS